MTRTVVLGEPPAAVADSLRHRKALGQDLFDEVWVGEYHVAPAAHSRHGDVDDQVAALLRPRARRAGLWPTGPVNIGGPGDYRVSDRAYFTHATRLCTGRPPRSLSRWSRRTTRPTPSPTSTTPVGWRRCSWWTRCAALEWYRRGADGFERTDRSALLEVTEAELTVEIGWP